MTLDPHADRSALRLKLYENGFSPLPNKRKMCLLPGWSTIKVTPEEINSKAWARSKAFLDTGIRCGDVIGLDWDIDDPALLNDLLDAVVAQGLVEESPFVRIGKPPRELWVFRTSDKIGKRTTGHFVPPGSAPEFSGYAVEILGAGCQFAAYGQRDDTTAYAWPEQSLLDHAYMDLPVITLKQVDALKDFCAAFLESRGLERRSPGGGTDGGYTHAYDLTAEMEFDVQELGHLTLAELDAALRANPEEVLRVTVDAFRPTSGSWAGMASLVGGAICISDHGTYTSHFPEDLDTRRSMAALGEMLAKLQPTSDAVQLAEHAAEKAAELPTGQSAPDLDPRDPFDTNLAKALERYVLIVDRNTIHDLQSSTTDLSRAAFETMLENVYDTVRGAKGGEQVTYLADAWFKHKDRVMAKTVALRPDQPWPFYTVNNEVHFNTYRPPLLGSGGDPEPGMAFLRRLLPIEAECRYFTQWLAYKLLHPAVRGPGIIMVAHEEYGTGRGTLTDLIRAMVGHAMVQTIDFATLAGKTYQSQYNEWLVDSLFVTINEAQEVPTGTSKWQARNNAYEHLKDIIDPSQQNIYVVRKGGKSGQGKTFASILVYTNHMDSIILPPGDRRFGILENGKPEPPEYWQAFREWMADPDNVGAFVEQLKQTDLAGYNPFQSPPMTAAKAEMVDAGASDLDRFFARAMAQFSNTLLVVEQLVLRMEDDIADSAVELPDDWRKMINLKFLRATRRPPTGIDRVRIDGKQRTVRMVGRPEARALQDEESVLQEVLRNGSVVRQVKTGNVVAFPMR